MARDYVVEQRGAYVFLMPRNAPTRAWLERQYPGSTWIGGALRLPASEAGRVLLEMNSVGITPC